jgi:predicted nucleic acid-binding protein
VADIFILDTSALLTFIEDEPGADQVQAVLFEAAAGRSKLYACFVSLTEVQYITHQERGEIVAQQRLADLRKLQIQWVHSDDELCSAAAKLKAAHRMSFANSFVAATAQRFDATLIHKDPEFQALATILKQIMLPPK